MRPVVVLVAASTLLAGCALFASDVTVPDHIVVQASDALWIDGWAYDGSGVVEGEGSMTIDVVVSEGTGDAGGSVVVDGSEYEFHWQEFSGENGTPKENGLWKDFQEHGATGNGHDLIPELHAVVSGWGTANLTEDGLGVFNPMTGQRDWDAHFMVTDTGIRDDESRQVLAEDGSVYSPDKAGQGRSVPDDHEVHVVLRSGPAETEPRTLEGNGSLTPTQSSAMFRFGVEHPQTTVEADVSVSNPDGSASLSAVNVSLHGQAGRFNVTTLGGPGNPSNVTWRVGNVFRSGQMWIELQTESSGAADWETTVDLTPPEPVFLHFLYETASWSAGS